MKSIIPGEDDKRCFICQKYGPEHVHHCLHGPYRWLADKYGLTVHLCVSCHMLLHDKGRYDRELESLAQEAFESKYSHEEFMQIFQKNWR